MINEWFRRVCDLEAEGRFDEANQLFEANTTPTERERFTQFAKTVAEAVGRIPPESIAETNEILKRFRALKTLPEDHPKRKIWDQFWHSDPAFMAPFWRFLPDPTAAPGRPKNSGKITEDMLAEMDQKCAENVRPTTAARAIVGKIAGQKNRADHLVRVWKRSRGIN